MPAETLHAAGRLALSLLAMALAACGAPHVPPPAHGGAVQTADVHATSGQAPCPSLAAASNLWAGFKEQTALDQMYVALDQVAPIRRVLGDVFCRLERREQAAHHLHGQAPQGPLVAPVALVSVELVDTAPSGASVVVRLPDGREAQLSMVYRAGGWRVVGESLRALGPGVR